MPPATTTANGEVSRFRLILMENKSKPFGNLISEAVLLAELEAHGSVWGLTMSREGTTCHVTFRQPETVEKLVKKGSMDINGLTVVVKQSQIQPGSPVRLPALPPREHARNARARADAAQPPEQNQPYLSHTLLRVRTLASRRAPSRRRSWGSSLRSRCRSRVT